MSVTRTYTVTVVSTGSGNKYFIDGVQQDTLYLAESGTYKFDQADSSNGGHPLRFSTTSDGTHNEGSEYTTGVTTNGTPGSSGAYTQIVVATDAPTLYYYCQVHPGMGGTANTPASNTWGALGWSSNRWGSTSEIVLGWGGSSWDDGEWNDLGDRTIDLTGQSITSAVGSVTVTDLTLGISGVEATASVAVFGTATGFGIQAYSNVDTGSNSSYTDVATGSNTSYTDAA